MANVQVWAYGQEQNFVLDENEAGLHQQCYVSPGNIFDKFQIVLHCTAMNRPATTVIDNWIRAAQQWVIHGSPIGRRASAHFVVDRNEHHPDSTRPYAHVTQVPDVTDKLRCTTRHSELSRNSIGIEIVNFGHFTYEDNQGIKRGVPYNQEERLPSEVRSNPNSYFRMFPPPKGNCGPKCYQAYQDKQYKALVLLLRYLCTELGIRRIFSGHNADTNLEQNWPLPTGHMMRRFRGLFSHCNIHPNKTCGGPALHRNRLYRGITDEWWLPIEPGGERRLYYTGPFDERQGFLNLMVEQPERVPLVQADINALQDTRSYYELDSEDSYFEYVESIELGSFPLGRNWCWHGGVHFIPREENLKVYAAASGTIVAARVVCEDDLEEQMGSSRFVLIKHTVFLETEGSGGETRFDYEVDPKIVFSLYMHLGRFANENDTDNGNPEWFNRWCELNPGGSDSSVFNPEMEIMVGDHLGECGPWYEQDYCLHFETISDQWFDLEPWSTIPENCVESSVYQPGPTSIASPIVTQTPADLRNLAVRHPSEWELTEQDLQQPIDRSSTRDRIWSQIQQINWLEDARTVSADIAEHLPQNNPVHYHPIVLMHYINSQLRHQGDFAGSDTMTFFENPQPDQASTSDFSASRREAASGGIDTIVIPMFRFSV